MTGETLPLIGEGHPIRSWNRVQRLLHALNAIEKPEVMVAAGVFCGNTCICNAGAAAGPGACYKAQRLLGIEIEADPAGLAAENLEQSDPGGISEIVEGDAISWLQAQRPAIDLLYIDADGAYLEAIAAAAEVCLKSGSLVLAHNSENLVHEIGDYLTFVRDPAHSTVSVNVVIDDAGLEVTRWR